MRKGRRRKRGVTHTLHKTSVQPERLLRKDCPRALLFYKNALLKVELAISLIAVLILNTMS